MKHNNPHSESLLRLLCALGMKSAQAPFIQVLWRVRLVEAYGNEIR
jgi:hypothetical protein